MPPVGDRRVPTLAILVLFLLACAAALGSGAAGVEAAPAQSIDLTFIGNEIRVRPALPGRASWDLRLRLTRYGAPDDLRVAEDPFPLEGEGGVDLLRGPLIETFRSGPKGIEHLLELHGWGEPSLLWFEFTLSGSLTPKVSEDGQTVLFRDPAGAASLAYLDLRALDGEEREVAARWERVEPEEDSGVILRLVLEGRDHLFPLRLLGRIAAPKSASIEGDAPVADSGTTTLAAPSNDLCAGAAVIPGGGPFPYLSSTFDLTDATTTGDPPVPSCQANLSRSAWFVFTPSTSAPYDLSVCSDAPTATTLEDTVLAVYAASGACTGLVEITGGCADDTCGPLALQSALYDVPLSAGTTYYIVAWSYGTAAPPPGAGSVQLSVVKKPNPGPAPPNDQCAGAEIIPPAGPFPYLTSVTADIGSATSFGDPPAPSCQTNVSRSIWYAFTPATGGRYAFSVCADGPTGTTVDDTVLAVYSGSGSCSGFVEIPGACDDDSCAGEAAQSSIAGVNLTGGTTYYIVAWKYGSVAPAAGNTAVQVRVSQVTTPPNDTCAAAPSLPLDDPVSGSTVSASDDVRLPSGSACFAGVGQALSTASGVDVAYRFTAPEAGRYSFRLSGYDPSKNAVLYVASDCPSGSPPALIASCLGAANRNATAPEEVIGLPLASGQTVYVYIDEDSATTGSAFTLEANRCSAEIEPNGSPASAGERACGLEGSISPAGDVDFFPLGITAAGSRVFAMVDGAAGNSTDFDLRVTTAVDTLEYDDFNNDVPFGAVSPNLSGTRLTGAPSYLRVSHYSAAAQAEPYRLYASIRPASTEAAPEVEPDNTIATATAGADEYFSGSLSDASDVDIFSFPAATGDLIQIGLDLDPSRDNTPFNGSLALLDGSGATLVLVNDTAFSSTNTSGNGSLTASTPSSPGESLVYRIRSTGTYYARVAWSSGTPGDYLLSISHGCRVNPPFDLGVTQSDSLDPVAPGGTVTYSIVITNHGSGAAGAVTLKDEIPAGASLVSASAGQGICAGSGPVVCHLGDLGSGASASVSVIVAAPLAPGPIANTARVSSANIDEAASNDASTETTNVGSADSDGDGVPDPGDCAPSDPAAWAIPGEATGLKFPTSDTTSLQWSAPSAPGGSVVHYDLLRAPASGSFQTPTCLSTNTTSTSGVDAASPAKIFYYLVRSRNVCGGNVGTKSNGTPRSAGTCP